jgi:hypothetical protein
MSIKQCLLFGLLLGGWGVAAAQAPAGATGICKDGTYTTAAAKAGACAGHKGVQTWYAAAPTAGAASTPAAATETVPPMTPAPTAKGPAAAAAAKTAAPGGAPNLVWLNTASNVYHCYGTTYYGKTKAGAYMTEADAKAKGAHGERGQTCSK